MNYSGISYPVKPGRKGLFNIETDIKLIQGNIIQILATRKGERVMLPLFGSKILDFIHEPLDHVTCSLLRFEVINTVSTWEPRIILDRENTIVTPYPDEFRVMAQLRYQIKLFHLQQSLILEINRREEVLPWLD